VPPRKRKGSIWISIVSVDSPQWLRV
jgi:hypothetical protein